MWFQRFPSRNCTPLFIVGSRFHARPDRHRRCYLRAVLTMRFPDERCCDRSGADGGPRGPFDTVAPPVSSFPDAFSGSQSCGGFLHPAAALLQRVLQPRTHDDLDLLQRAL